MGPMIQTEKISDLDRKPEKISDNQGSPRDSHHFNRVSEGSAGRPEKSQSLMELTGIIRKKQTETPFTPTQTLIAPSVR